MKASQTFHTDGGLSIININDVFINDTSLIIIIVITYFDNIIND